MRRSEVICHFERRREISPRCIPEPTLALLNRHPAAIPYGPTCIDPQHHLANPEPVDAVVRPGAPARDYSVSC
jgi:hypothetical protein